eukprot:gene8869-biopygen3751
MGSGRSHSATTRPIESGTRHQRTSGSARRAIAYSLWMRRPSDEPAPYLPDRKLVRLGQQTGTSTKKLLSVVPCSTSSCRRMGIAPSEPSSTS